MNHIYRLVWSEIANTWVAVAEIARGRGKRSSTVGASPKLDEATVGWAMPVLSLSKRPTMSGIARPTLSFTQSYALLPLALAFAIIGAPAHALDVGALPTGGSVTAGSAAISQTANVLTVQQVSQRAAIDWKSFNIGVSATVNFNQPNANAVALNRIGGNSASEIYGKLNANGQVFFSNPNGMLFARGAQVNVGGILATTLSIGNSDFMAGNYRLTNPGSGSIRNEGIINALGSVALIGNTTHNAGKIIATTVTLAAGNTVAIDLTVDGLIRARVEDAALKSSIENSGSIDGAQITLTAGQAREALDRVVNNSGIIRAIGLTMKGGEILLEGAVVENTGSIVASGTNGGGTIKLLGDMVGGTVKVGGTLDASASLPSPLAGEGLGERGSPANGGFIETSAAHVQMADTARITTAATNGKTGTWLIDPNDYTIAASGGDITGTVLSTNLGTTNVTILSSSGATAGNGDINVNDVVSWSANTLTLTAARDININAVMTASGTSILALNPATANGADGALIDGAVKVGLSAGGFIGRVDFSGRSGTGFLTIGGAGYTVINDVTALQGMSGNIITGRYALGSDIDASATSGWNGGLGFAPIGTGPAASFVAFKGRFDGLGHTITGLSINRPTADYVGLFGFTNGARIGNVGLINGSVSGRDFVGGLVGQTWTSAADKINNSYNTGSVTGSGAGGMGGVGGLVGYNAAVITNSYNTGIISGGILVGGLTGKGGNIGNSYNTGAVSGSGGTTFVGGLTGEGGGISNSYNSGSVSGIDTVGGLVGYQTGGNITNSYNSGNVSGSTNVGGLGGWHYGGAITNSYSTGTVTGTTNVGGLVGNRWSGSGAITSSYWDNTQTPGNCAGIGSIVGCTGLTTAQMKQQASFTGWDFATIWRIYEGYTYPILKSFLTPLTVTANAASKTYNGLAYSGGNGVTYNVASPTLSGTLTYGGTSQGAVNTGSYLVTPGGLYSNQQGYDISYVNGALTIAAASPAPAPTDNTWLGLLDSYWTTIGNWSLGHVPIATETVLIPDVAGTAFIQMADGTYTVKNITSAELFKLTGSGTSFTLTQSGAFNAGLDLGAGTSLTSQGTLSLSSYTLGSGAKINLTQSGTGILTIGGLPYTVINSLGAAGSATALDLQGMSGNLAGRYALGSNIDASVTSSWNSFAGFAPVGNSTTKFTGAFDGLGHTITGLTINRPTTSYIGLFGYVGPSSILKNVGLINGNITGEWYVGGLAGYNDYGTITNSYNTGAVNGASYVGGLAGFNWGGTIASSYNTGAVNGASYVGAQYVGGLAGVNWGTISNSYNTGAVNDIGSYTGGLVGVNYVTITNSYSTGVVSGGGSHTGGLAGWNSGGTISNSYSTGAVSGSGYYVGGLAGYSSGTISNSYNTGAVSGRNNWVGGLAGYNDFGTIANSYNTGAVSGTDYGNYVGGLAGRNDFGTIADSYNTGTVSGSYNNVGGLAGINWVGSTIANSYNTGVVSGRGNNVGGLAGYSDGTFTNSYWDTQTSGKSKCIGSGSGVGCTGLTTAQMKQQASFTGWDFSTVWNIDQGTSFPYLRANEQNPHPTAPVTTMTALSLTTSSAIRAIATVIQQTVLTPAPSAFVAMTKSPNADSQIAALNPTTAGDASAGGTLLAITVAGITLQKPADEVVRLVQPKGSMLTCPGTSL